VKKNALKVSILAWLALLLSVFSCESGAGKERVVREKEIAREDSILKIKEDSIQAWADSIKPLLPTLLKIDTAWQRKARESSEVLRTYGKTKEQVDSIERFQDSVIRNLPGLIIYKNGKPYVNGKHYKRSKQ